MTHPEVSEGSGEMRVYGRRATPHEQNPERPAPRVPGRHMHVAAADQPRPNRPLSSCENLGRMCDGSMTACPTPRSGLAFRMGQKLDRYGQGQLGGVRARRRRRVDDKARGGNVSGARPPREYWRNGNRRRSPRQRGAASRGEDGTNCATEGLFPCGQAFASSTSPVPAPLSRAAAHLNHRRHHGARGPVSSVNMRRLSATSISSSPRRWRIVSAWGALRSGSASLPRKV